MSRFVNLDEPLSEDDRRYLLERDRQADVAANEARFGNQSEKRMNAEDHAARIAELREELAKLEAEDRAANATNVPPYNGPTATDRTLVVGKDGKVFGSEIDDDTSSDDTDEDDGIDDDDEEVDYDEMTAEELRNELSRRSLPTNGRKQELVDRLENDDRTRA